MVLASHQPDFFPYMGYYYKVFRSDVFVLTDNVLFSKQGRHNYNEILTANGPKKFTLPIHYKLADLNEIEIAAGERDITKMLKTLRQDYSKAEHFDEVFPVIEDMFHRIPEARSLAEWNTWGFYAICSRMGMLNSRKVYISSDLDIKESRDDRLIELCKRFGCDTYYSGTGAKDYHIDEKFDRNGIRLVYSDYEPLEYLQVYGKAQNMSVLDYLFNCGFEIPKEWKRDV